MTEIPLSLKPGRSFEFNEPGHDHVWQSLLSRDSADVAQKAQAGLVGEHVYLVELYGENYLFEAAARRVTGPAHRPAPDKRVVLSLLHYLNGALDEPLSGRLVPETVLPGGDRFFSGGHALARQPILKAFGRNGAALIAGAAGLGGQAVQSEAGSFSFAVQPLPRLKLQVTLCEEDEEFPADLYFAFDSTAADHVSLGILASLVGLLNTLLAENL